MQFKSTENDREAGQNAPIEPVALVKSVSIPIAQAPLSSPLPAPRSQTPQAVREARNVKFMTIVQSTSPSSSAQSTRPIGMAQDNRQEVKTADSLTVVVHEQIPKVEPFNPAFEPGQNPDAV